jgi:hypothetical protein
MQTQHGDDQDSKQDKALREQLVAAVQGGQAHLDIPAVFDEVSLAEWGATIKGSPQGSPHTLWQLLEHIRFTLEDLITFSTDKEYEAPDWPKDYWPDAAAPATAIAAKQSLDALKQAVATMTALLRDPKTDLFAKIPWGDGQTILREALLAATHTSYHLGQAMMLRKQLER